jgi:uncharacterized protein YndB with AHSA1/START domain
MKWVARSLLALIVVFVVTLVGLWLASNRSDAGRMRASIEIARPAEVIWPWMVEPARLTQWVGWLEAVEDDSTSPAEGIGHRETWVMNDPRMKEKMRVPGAITLWEPPNQLGVHVALPGMFEGDVLYKLTDLGNGRTRVEQDGRYRYESRLTKLLEPMITPDAMRKVVADLNRLRQLVEAEAFTPDPGDVDSLEAVVDTTAVP